MRASNREKRIQWEPKDFRQYNFQGEYKIAMFNMAK